jgi:hypothetical protein
MRQKIRKRDRKRFRVFPDRFLGIAFSVGKIPYFKNRMKYGKSPASLLWPISRLPDFIPRSSKLCPQLRFTELLAEQPSRYVEEVWSLPGKVGVVVQSFELSTELNREYGSTWAVLHVHMATWAVLSGG